MRPSQFRTSSGPVWPRPTEASGSRFLPHHQHRGGRSSEYSTTYPKTWFCRDDWSSWRDRTLHDRVSGIPTYRCLLEHVTRINGPQGRAGYKIHCRGSSVSWLTNVTYRDLRVTSMGDVGQAVRARVFRTSRAVIPLWRDAGVWLLGGIVCRTGDRARHSRSTACGMFVAAARMKSHGTESRAFLFCIPSSTRCM